jgi:hypothetical protein
MRQARAAYCWCVCCVAATPMHHHDIHVCQTQVTTITVALCAAGCTVVGALPGSLCQQQQQGSPGWSLVVHLMQDTG